MKRVVTIQQRESFDNYLCRGVFLDIFLPKMSVVGLWYTSTISGTSGYYWHRSFTGKERDEETGYGYFGARYMDHDLMTMWLSVDPMADKYPSILEELLESICVTINIDHHKMKVRPRNIVINNNLE